MQFVGVLAHADDLTLLAPCPSAMRTRILAVAETMRLLRGSVSAKCNWETIFCGHYMSIFNHTACKAIEFDEMTQNKGYYAVQGHSRSPISVPIVSPYATISD